MPFERAGGELLFNLLADRYERRSTIVTTNLIWIPIVSSTEPRFPRRPAPLRRRLCEDDDSEPGKEG